MELGSEFNLNVCDLEISQNSFFEYIGDLNYCLFDSGRSALKSINGILGDGMILLPEYICESVIKCFPEEKIAFYKLRDNLQVDLDDLQNKLSNNVSAFYLMHYFGSLQFKYVLSFLQAAKEKCGFAIIEDTTHSMFSEKQTIGDYCIASLRKWFAIPNGGVIYTKNPLIYSYNEIRRSLDNEKAYAMMLKTLYLKGRLNCNSEYREMFAKCEEKLDTQTEVKRISDYSEFLLRCFDICETVHKRKSNLNYIKSKLSSIGIKQLCDFSENDCPLALPILVADRDGLQMYLKENKIYCAVHWPFDGRAISERPSGVALSKNMLSLPIDQRYGEEEMEYLIKVISAYKGRLRF